MALSAEVRGRLQDILEHIEGIRATVSGADFDTFRSTYHMERTVERGVQIISEAAKNLPEPVRAAAPGVEWAKIVGIGNLLRHEYYRIRPDIMWDIAINKLPELETAVRRILAGSEG